MGRPAARVTSALAVLAVGGCLVAVRAGAVDDLDHRLGGWLARPRGPLMDRLVGVATDLGSTYGVAGASLALAARGRRRSARRLALAGGTAWCVAQAAKPLAGRGRPYQAQGAARLIAEPAGSSWPSGHAAVAAAMAVSLGEDLAPRARVLAALAATGVAASRLYVGVHHPSDVLAGAGLGVACAGLWRGRRPYDTDSGSERPTIER